MSTHLEELGLLVKRVQHGHHRALDAGLAPLGVTLVQWNALRELDRNPGANQHQLAERTFNSDQAFGTLVTRLEAAALVERSPGEGRAAVLTLTRKGKGLLRAGEKVMGEVVAASFAPLKKSEQAELARLLGKILEARSR